MKRATTFVSYTGAYTFEDFVKILEQIDGNEYVWIDIFCVNQFMWTGRGGDEEFDALRIRLTNELKGRIQEIGRTSLMVKQWNDVMATLGQTWVLWEVFNTVETGVPFSLLLSDQETSRYLEGMSSASPEFQSVQDAISRIDCSKTTSTDTKDRNIILKRMEEHGLLHVSKAVATVVREWLINVGRRYVQQKRQEDRLEPTLLSHFGQLLSYQGMFGEAENVEREALGIDRQHFGDEHPRSLASMSNLAVLLLEQGKLSEAESLFRKVLSIRRSIFGDKHLDVLTDMNNLASVWSEQGRYQDAAPLYDHVLRIRSRVLGFGHPQALNAMNNLATLLISEGRYSDAEPLLQKVLSAPDYP